MGQVYRCILEMKNGYLYNFYGDIEDYKRLRLIFPYIGKF